MGRRKGCGRLVIDKEATGGQAGTSSRIENYLGFPQGLSGAELARRATTQAQRLGAEILTPRSGRRCGVEDPYRIVTLDDGSELSCHGP
jgi:thioredoxin reductase (NADPH)